jgi:hypothetical protein
MEDDLLLLAVIGGAALLLTKNPISETLGAGSQVVDSVADVLTQPTGAARHETPAWEYLFPALLPLLQNGDVAELLR